MTLSQDHVLRKWDGFDRFTPLRLQLSAYRAAGIGNCGISQQLRRSQRFLGTNRSTGPPFSCSSAAGTVTKEAIFFPNQNSLDDVQHPLERRDQRRRYARGLLRKHQHSAFSRLGLRTAQWFAPQDNNPCDSKSSSFYLQMLADADAPTSSKPGCSYADYDPTCSSKKKTEE